MARPSSDSDPLGSIQLNRDGSLRHQLRIPYSGSHAVLYNVDSGDYFFSENNHHFPIAMEEGRWVYRRSHSVDANTRSPQLLSTRAQQIVERLEAIGQENLSSKWGECQNLLRPYERFSQPLSADEKNQCREVIETGRAMATCSFNKTCDEVFRDYLADNRRSETRINSPELYENVQGVSPAIKNRITVATGTTLANVGGWAAVRALALRGIIGGRVTLAWWGISSASQPVIQTFFDFDECGNRGLRPGQERTIADCRGRTGEELREIFHEELARIIADPNRFETLAQSSDGRVARMACLAIEGYIHTQGRNFREATEVRCDGRTMVIGDHRYIIASDGHLYRNEGRDHVLRFYPNGEAYLEQNPGGLRVPLHEPPNLSEVRRPSQQERREAALANIQRYQTELMMVSAVNSRVQNLISHDQCLRVGEEAPAAEAADEAAQ